MKKIFSSRNFLLGGMLALLSMTSTGCKTTNGVKDGKRYNTNCTTSTTLDNLRDDSEGYFRSKIRDKVYFEYDNYNLSEEALKTLRGQAEWLKRNDKFCLTIEGHADERGTREYNLALGERRANMVKRALIKNGIECNKIKTVSFGKERPEENGSNEEAWALNRRAVTVLKKCS